MPWSICATSPTSIGRPAAAEYRVVKGHQAVLLEILKTGDASTLAVVSGVQAKLPAIAQDAAAGRHHHAAEQRLQLRARIDRGCRRRRWSPPPSSPDRRPVVRRQLAIDPDRRDLHSAIDPELDPGAVLVGQTINVMTLGGLALAVGILVDDATVMIENINTHLEQRSRRQLRAESRSSTPPTRSSCRPSYPRSVSASSGCRCSSCRRRRRLPVPAARRGDRLRDDRLLHPVAHADADHGGLAVARRRWQPAASRGGTQPEGIFDAIPSGIRDGVSIDSATAIAELLESDRQRRRPLRGRCISVRRSPRTTPAVP